LTIQQSNIPLTDFSLDDSTNSIRTLLQDLQVRIKSSRYESFVRGDFNLIFGTGPLCTNSAKVPNSSFPAFGPSDISEIRDLLPFLNKATTGTREEFIVYLIREVEIKRPQSYEEGETIAKEKEKGKATGRGRPRTVSSTCQIPNPKRARLQNVKQESESELEVSSLFSYDSLY
jgi:hypothetical protein